MSTPRNLRSSTLDFAAAEALATFRDCPAAANSFPDAAERACAACLHDVRVAALPGTREVLTLCSSILRGAREGISPPASAHDIDAAILACSRWRALSPPREVDVLRVQPRSWTTIPKDVLRYLLQWLRALGGIGGYRDDAGGDGRAALYSCALVCRTRNLIGTEELWRSVVVPGKVDSMGRVISTIRRSYQSRLVGPAPIGLYVRAVRFGVNETFPETSFEFVVSNAVHFLPNLRSIAMLLRILPEPRGLDICWGRHRLSRGRRGELLEYLPYRKSDHPRRSPPSVPGLLHLLAVTAYRPRRPPRYRPEFGILERAWQRCDSLNLGNLRLEHKTIIAARCRHLVTVDLSNGAKNQITDDVVQTLLPLKSHRPITFLSLGGEEDHSLFEAAETDNALCELLSACGVLLTRLRLGHLSWRMGLDLATLLPDALGRLQCLHLLGVLPSRSGAWLAHRLLALRHLPAGDLDALGTFVPPPVHCVRACRWVTPPC
ncbi:hypothetical protein BDK51DRAFT_37736 [Blyttiomyces helicus]|uniref:Uncharacterized protein n=1 Tax=Blyttiomyces helicus TaxID=388810 RepID=A0A4P9WDD2_9FUNG|nr:hypothetical protein BDK51DRAFT_37736 [Blyttiomyces helicus]|eukprot:RKO89228.1 hypothetical protein BDK51DRAFT_37736 [Blyttiomyces helicus]